jgi:hypothetical protein
MVMNVVFTGNLLRLSGICVLVASPSREPLINNPLKVAFEAFGYAARYITPLILS